MQAKADAMERIVEAELDVFARQSLPEESEVWNFAECYHYPAHRRHDQSEMAGSPAPDTAG